MFDPGVKPTAQSLKEIPPLCADGAWGTELQKRGVKPGEVCELWNLEHPDRVREVAEAYIAAGAQVIITNTFSCSPISLADHGLADRAGEIARAGAEISRQAAEGRAWVFASIGPCGKMVMMGEVDPQEVEDGAALIAEAMADGGADAILIETQTDLAEGEAIIKGVQKACDLPTGLSFSFGSGPGKDRTMMGVSVADVCALAADRQAAFVGSNCGTGVETFAEIAGAFVRSGVNLPLWFKGNAGLPEVDARGNTVFRSPPEAYSDAVPALLEAGAKFIGGCCGSTPAHIRAIAETLKRIRG